MADHTKIEWTDSTWNALRGCSKVSEGCRNCYACAMAARFSKPGQWGEELAEPTCGGPRWTGKVVLDEKALLKPLRWKKPRRIFVTSIGDPFHPAVTNEMLDRLFAVMALCPQHTFQLLTKRPERMREYFVNCEHRIAEWTVLYAANTGPDGDTPRAHPPLRMGPWTGNTVMDIPRPVGFETWPLPNLWLGVSIEDQPAANKRLPHLLATPAAVRFVSGEPLLGLINLTPWIGVHPPIYAASTYTDPDGVERYDMTGGAVDGLDWVIVGGESGPKARPMHPDWVRFLRDQCADAGLPFMFKQWGEWAYDPEIHSEVLESFDAQGRTADGPMIRIGKAAAGRQLDGQIHDAYPLVAHA